MPEDGPLLALAPGGDARGWAEESYAATARRLVSGAGGLGGARVALLGDGDAFDRLRSIAASLDADGVPALNLAGRLDLLGSAALLERATLCIGGDDALVHVAAATGAPALGLYGRTDERLRGPYGPRARALRGRPFAELLTEAEDGQSDLADISVDMVEAAARELVAAGGVL